MDFRMSASGELGIVEMSPERYTHLLIKACRQTVGMTDILSTPMQHNGSTRCLETYTSGQYDVYFNGNRDDKRAICTCCV